ncbi:DJ-1/PfpI family protein [Kordiimonas aquimaris]|uniref:DJ-1/PfpI family protein n=1 Tax=Kordiimonas aquimaris TaxID=707591 RepID=UPI0021D0A12F|nr:DJ-1/PfpI family protein [Kordiimonas aquimaris]
MAISINRRAFSSLIASALIVPIRAAVHANQSDQPSAHDMSNTPEEWTGKERIYMLAYPGMTALDLVGPQYMFASLMGAEVKVIAKDSKPIVSDTGLTIMPDATFNELPEQITLIFAPGGTTGTLNAMRDAETIAFLKMAGARAEYVTSVCTGSMLLAKAGLLEGYKATSHWLTHPALENFGAIPTEGRVVIDRNRITGAGVSAGLDFGLSLVGKFRDQNYAESVQLLCEYAPEPPYNSGSQETAKPEQVHMLQSMLGGFVDLMKAEA